MAGGKGGRSSTSVEIPSWLEAPARRNIARADEIARIGYVPYYGPDVAAFTPMQLSAGRNISSAAGAFGLGGGDPMAGMPVAYNYGGMPAYSSAPIYEQSLTTLEARRPGQFAALNAPFIDPITGAPPAAPFDAYGSVYGGGGDMGVAGGSGSDNFGGDGGSSDFFMPTSGGSGDFGRRLASNVGSYLPGGVNTRNSDSILNRIAAGARDEIAGGRRPSAATRPVARPSGSDRSSGMRGGK